MKTRFHKTLCSLILCSQLVYLQTVDTTKDKLENQQNYIRNLVEKEKDQILKNYLNSDSSGKMRTELQRDKLPSIDSLLLKNKVQLQVAQSDATALNKATIENPRKKSNLKKIMLIGGFSGGAIAGALAYFLSNGKNSKSGSPSDNYIDDKPPIHP